jgi:hypothetical protein
MWRVAFDGSAFLLDSIVVLIAAPEIEDNQPTRSGIIVLASTDMSNTSGLTAV